MENVFHNPHQSALQLRVVMVFWLSLIFSWSATAQNTFYDAYEVGLAHERAGRWSAALAALETAVELRPDAGRNVPTFGRDVIEVYDPYLHLARVELELGRRDDAAADLARARSASVSPASEISALAARMGEATREPIAPTVVPSTATPFVASEPTRAPQRTRPAPAGEPRPGPSPSVTETPAPVSSAPQGPADEPAAARPETDPAEDGGGGGPVLLVLVAAVVVVVWLRRRRSRRQIEPSPDYDTTPTRRVETGTGKASADVSASSADGEALRIGEYSVLGRLGRGGMATTYRAEHTSDGRVVALKIPHEHLLDDAEFVERFLREGALGATIHHPNIIRIFEAGRHEDTPFIAMEIVDGETLETRLARDGALPVADSLEIARGVALALDYAHVKGVVHRDVKPDNIMLLADGSVKVMDFGIARVAAAPGLTATNTYLGTPLYSAPEAIDPAEVGPHSDLYSLGIVLYRMLSNRAPFEAPSPLKVIELHRTEPLPRLAPELAVPEAVEAMVRRLTAKRREERFPSAEVFLDELNRYLTGRATRPSPGTSD